MGFLLPLLHTNAITLQTQPACVTLRPVPKKTILRAVRLTAEQERTVKLTAINRKVTVSVIIRAAIERYTRKNDDDACVGKPTL